MSNWEDYIENLIFVFGKFLSETSFFFYPQCKSISTS